MTLDIITARVRDFNDHIEWLLDAKQYIEALYAVENAGPENAGLIKASSIIDIGLKFINSAFDDGKYIMMSGRFEEAAVQCPKVLRNDAKMWELFSEKFLETGKINKLLPYIPFNAECTLSTGIYDAIIRNLFQSDIHVFII